MKGSLKLPERGKMVLLVQGAMVDMTRQTQMDGLLSIGGDGGMGGKKSR
jgi:hypothetical protein